MDLEKKTVLVLNRAWQAINTCTPKMAFCMVSADVATALDIDGENHLIPAKWSDWVNLPVRESDNACHTVSRSIRIPTVIVLSEYSKVPKKRPRLSMSAVREKQRNRCAYTNRELGPGEGNLDHVKPRSRGGATTWENIVYADKKINSQKADKTPEEAGLILKIKPSAPKEIPVTACLSNPHQIPDWRLFLNKTS
jgi:5-methylcytosine-specific restriction endonuclease McrA